MPRLVPYSTNERVAHALGSISRTMASTHERRQRDQAFELEKARAESLLLREENARLSQEADRQAMEAHAAQAGARLADTTEMYAPQLLPGTQQRLARLNKLRPHMSAEGFAFALREFQAEEQSLLFNAGKTKLMAGMERSLRSPGIAEDQGGAERLSALAQAVAEAQTPQELARAEKAFQDEQKAVSKRRQQAKTMQRGVEYLEGVRRAFIASGDDEMTARVEGVLADWEADVFGGDYQDMRRALRNEMGKDAFGDDIPVPVPAPPSDPFGVGGPGIPLGGQNGAAAKAPKKTVKPATSFDASAAADMAVNDPEGFQREYGDKEWTPAEKDAFVAEHRRAANRRASTVFDRAKPSKPKAAQDDLGTLQQSLVAMAKAYGKDADLEELKAAIDRLNAAAPEDRMAVFREIQEEWEAAVIGAGGE